MPTYYSVVQYVPDPIADERINVGVVVFGDGQLRARFLHNWERVQRFAREDIDYVKAFAERIEGAFAVRLPAGGVGPMPGIDGAPGIDETAIRDMIENWGNSIQLSPAQSSLQGPDELVVDMAELFLKDEPPRQRGFRDRSHAVGVAVGTAKQAFARRPALARAGRYVASYQEMAGRVVQRHRVDVASRNGRFFSAAQALSFELRNVSRLDEQLSEAILSLRDVRERDEDLRIALVALRPREGTPRYRDALQRYQEARTSCRAIGATFVDEEELRDWAEALADSLLPSATAGVG